MILPILQILLCLIDYYPFSNLNKFRGKNFSRNDETIDTAENYQNNLDWEFFCKGIQSLRDRWQRVIASWRSVHSINAIIVVLRPNTIWVALAFRTRWYLKFNLFIVNNLLNYKFNQIVLFIRIYIIFQGLPPITCKDLP